MLSRDSSHSPKGGWPIIGVQRAGVAAAGAGHAIDRGSRPADSRGSTTRCEQQVIDGYFELFPILPGNEYDDVLNTEAVQVRWKIFAAGNESHGQGRTGQPGEPADTQSAGTVSPAFFAETRGSVWELSQTLGVRNGILQADRNMRDSA